MVVQPINKGLVSFNRLFFTKKGDPLKLDGDLNDLDGAARYLASGVGQELKLELVKSKVSGSKTGTSKVKQIKKMIARILTLNNSKQEVLSKK